MDGQQVHDWFERNGVTKIATLVPVTSEMAEDALLYNQHVKSMMFAMLYGAEERTLDEMEAEAAYQAELMRLKRSV